MLNKFHLLLSVQTLFVKFTLCSTVLWDLTHSSFSRPPNSLTRPLCKSPPPHSQPQATANLVFFLIVSTFPKWHIKPMTPYVCSLWGLASFTWETGLEIHPYCWGNRRNCLNVPPFAYPVTKWETSGFHPGFGNYESSCYPHACIGFYGNLSFPFSWVDKEQNGWVIQ